MDCKRCGVEIDYHYPPFCADCLPVVQREHQLKRAGVPAGLIGKRLHNYEVRRKEQKRAVEMCKKYVEEMRSGGKSWLLLCGQVGSGKTHLAVGVMFELVDVFDMEFELYTQMIANVRQKLLSDVYADYLDKLIDVPFLVVDDLFYMENIKDFEAQWVFDLINGRYVADRPMIITSKRGVDELIDVNEAIGSRIVEKARGFIFEFEGPNYRLNHKRENKERSEVR